jgi:hypothetical protein
MDYDAIKRYDLTVTVFYEEHLWNVGVRGKDSDGEDAEIDFEANEDDEPDAAVKAAVDMFVKQKRPKEI